MIFQISEITSSSWMPRLNFFISSSLLCIRPLHTELLDDAPTHVTFLPASFAHANVRID